MTYQPANSVQSYLPTTIVIPKDFESANPILTDYFKKIANALNSKDIAQYNTQEIITGQQFFTPNDNNRFRQTYRKAINFPAPLIAVNTLPHGLGALNTYTFTRIYGVFNNQTAGIFAPIPQGGANTSMLEVGQPAAADVTITAAAAYQGANWSAIVVLEYIKA